MNPEMCVSVKMHIFGLPADWILRGGPTTLPKPPEQKRPMCEIPSKRLRLKHHSIILMLSVYFACACLHPLRSVLSCSGWLHHDWCTQQVIVGLLWDKQSTAACSFPLILMSMYAPTTGRGGVTASCVRWIHADKKAGKYPAGPVRDEQLSSVCLKNTIKTHRV